MYNSTFVKIIAIGTIASSATTGHAIEDIQKLSPSALVRAHLPVRTSEDDDCRSAGRASDSRPNAKQYRCNEYEFGSTNLGLNPVEFQAATKCALGDQRKGIVRDEKCIADLDKWYERKINMGRGTVRIERYQNPASQKSKEELALWRTQKSAFRDTVTVKGKEILFSLLANRRANFDEDGQERSLELADGTRVRDSITDVHGNTFLQVRQDAKVAGALEAEACTFYPGVDLNGQSASQSWVEKLWFLKVASAKLTINPGSLSFNYMRICKTLRIDPNGGSGPLSLADIEDPKLYGLSRSGLKVDVSSGGLLKVFDFFAGFFGSTTSEKIQNLAEEKSDAYIEKKLANGEYMSGLLKPVIGTAVQAAKSNLQKSNAVLLPELENAIQSECLKSVPTEMRLTSAGTALCSRLVNKRGALDLLSLSLKNANGKNIQKTPWLKVKRGELEETNNYKMEVTVKDLSANIAAGL